MEHLLDIIKLVIPVIIAIAGWQIAYKNSIEQDNLKRKKKRLLSAKLTLSGV